MNWIITRGLIAGVNNVNYEFIIREQFFVGKSSLN